MKTSPPASTIYPATFLSPTSTLGLSNVEQSPPCLAPPAPTHRPAPHASTLHTTNQSPIPISFPTTHPSTSPISGPTETSQGNPHLIPRFPFHSIFQPPACLDLCFGVRLEITTRNFTTSPRSYLPQMFPQKPPWPVPSTYTVTDQENFHHVHPSILLFQTLFHHIPFHTPIQPPISITHHHSLHFPRPYSISHMGYTRPLWAATQITLHSYSFLDTTPGSSTGCSRVSSCAQELRRDYKPPNSYILLPLSLYSA